MQTLQVDLPGNQYPIHIGAGALETHLAQVVGPLARELIVVVTNQTIASLYADQIALALKGLPARVETVTIPDGEQYKTLDTLRLIFDQLMALQANRQTVLVAFGGGVVGDIAGFAAGTFMRGIPLVQVPTTLLAQVDSSVGGKTAVNHPQGKNGIGVFKQPKGVIIDPRFLATLPERERRAGLFELIKHGIIADLDLFDFLADHASAYGGDDWGFWEEAIYRSCAVKARVVEADEQERDVRATLNFGHTLGHLIETHTNYQAYLHGEAVGVGMLFAGFVSKEWGGMPEADFERMRGLLTPLVTPVSLPPLDRETFISLILHDKKASQNTVRFILLHGLSQVFVREGTSPEDLWRLFQAFIESYPGLCRASPT